MGGERNFNGGDGMGEEGKGGEKHYCMMGFTKNLVLKVLKQIQTYNHMDGWWNGLWKFLDMSIPIAVNVIVTS